MEINEYQKLAMRTANNDMHTNTARVYSILKLSGEAGELADYLGKHIGQGHEFVEEKIKEELGDLAWHLAYAAKVFGFTLEEVCIGNIDKLKKRYPKGFTVNDSVNRDKEGNDNG